MERRVTAPPPRGLASIYAARAPCGPASTSLKVRCYENERDQRSGTQADLWCPECKRVANLSRGVDETASETAATSPFCAHVLQLTTNKVPSFSACMQLTEVTITNELDFCGDPEASLTLLRMPDGATLRAWTIKAAAQLRVLPALRTVHLRFVSDPSIVVAACGPSLTYFGCFACATLTAGMPLLERFECHSQFAFSDPQAGVAALRGCVSLKTVHISRATKSVLEAVKALPQLQSAVIPACLEEVLAVQRVQAVRRNASPVLMLRGVVVRAFIKGGHPHLRLLWMLSFLLKARTLRDTNRVTSTASPLLHWVLFVASTDMFRAFWKKVRDMSLCAQ